MQDVVFVFYSIAMQDVVFAFLRRVYRCKMSSSLYRGEHSDARCRLHFQEESTATQDVVFTF